MEGLLATPMEMEKTTGKMFKMRLKKYEYVGVVRENLLQIYFFKNK